MRTPTWSERLRYEFDNAMSQGTAALIAWLFLLSALLILITSVAVMAAGLTPAQDGTSLDFFQLIWYSLMRAMDAGAIGGDTGHPFFLFLMLVNTLGGIFIVSILIGVLTTGVESQLEELRKGRSFVIEQGHTLILGWSPQIFSVLSELVIANASRPRACIVILADKDKVEMEDEIRARVGSTGRTRIVCRTGSPMELTDLEIANPHQARSIIVLAPETDSPDSHVIKTILAITNNPNRHPEPYHIVAEIRDPKNMEAARLVGRQEAQLVLVGDLISRITVQTCRQTGLSVVYQELLDFSGNEIYFHREPTLAGKTFGEAMLLYEDAALIGLLLNDGRVQLNPPMDHPIAAGEQVVVIAADDDRIKVLERPLAAPQAEAIRTPQERPQQPERTLILGWNPRALTIVSELDQYVAPGSEVLIVAEGDEVEREATAAIAPLTQQRATFRQGDTTDRRTLDELMAEPYHHIIVLSPADAPSAQEADARTLITLLHLRDIAERLGRDFSIVTEMLDIRNRELAEVTRADDFIVSDKLVSLIMAQVSENRNLALVFTDLFDPEGAELYLKPAEDYVALDQPTPFYTVVESARQQGQVAIGYQLASQAARAGAFYGIQVNPPKSQPVTFSAADRIIVLAEK